VRPRVNPDTCEAAGFCQQVAPEVFRVRPDGIAEAMVEDVPEGLVPDVEEAALLCPTRSIALSDD
jgi:ferredoxin